MTTKKAVLPEQRKINIAIPAIIMKAITTYITKHEIDTKPVAYARILISQFGHKPNKHIDTMSRNIYNRMYFDKQKTVYVCIRTRNECILNEPLMRQIYLIKGMIMMGIPIPKYFDGVKEIGRL